MHISLTLTQDQAEALLLFLRNVSPGHVRFALQDGQAVQDFDQASGRLRLALTRVLRSAKQ
jgi:hypothetical protein